MALILGLNIIVNLKGKYTVYIIVLCDKTKGIALLKADEIEDLADKVFQK